MVFRGSVSIDAAPTGLKNFLHRYRRYATEEGFEIFKVSASYPVRLGNRTYRAGDDGAVANRTIGVNFRKNNRLGVCPPLNCRYISL